MNEQKLDTLLLENNLGESLRGLSLSNTTMRQIPWSVCQLSNLQVLVVSDNRLTGFENTCFTNMTSLTHIYAERNLITKLHDGVFDGLNSLISLNLRRNRISDIGLHVFSNRSNLWKLQYIDLKHNLLTSLQDGVFDCLQSLNYLDLSANRISDIGLHVFSNRSDLLNLSSIDLTDNLLPSLQDGIFDGLKSIYNLNLGGNRISGIGLNVFSNHSNLWNLSSINLQGNLLTSLQGGLFDGLESLGHLYLSGNRISDIDLSVFSNRSNLRNLKYIEFNANLLTSLQDGIFDGLNSLYILDLSRNLISGIGLNVFSNRSNLSNLSSINLKGNLLTSLQGGLFDGLESLGQLDLSENRISDIDLSVFFQSI